MKEEPAPAQEELVLESPAVGGDPPGWSLAETVEQNAVAQAAVAHREGIASVPTSMTA